MSVPAPRSTLQPSPGVGPLWLVALFLSGAVAFPHVTSWHRGGILIGTLEPLALRPSDFEWKSAYPNVKEAFAQVGLTSFEKLLDTYYSGEKELRAYVAKAPCCGTTNR